MHDMADIKRNGRNLRGRDLNPVPIRLPVKRHTNRKLETEWLKAILIAMGGIVLIALAVWSVIG